MICRNSRGLDSSLLFLRKDLCIDNDKVFLPDNACDLPATILQDRKFIQTVFNEALEGNAQAVVR